MSKQYGQYRSDCYVSQSVLFKRLPADEERKITLRLFFLRAEIKKIKRKRNKQRSLENEKTLAVLSDEYDQHREVLILANTRLVNFMATSFINHIGQTKRAGLDVDDLFNEGIMGLRTAINRYNPCLLEKLSPYAALWIKSYLQRYIRRNLSIIYVPDYLFVKVRKFISINESSIGLSDKEIQDTIKTDIAKINHALNIIYPACVYLDHPISEDGDQMARDLIASHSLNQEDIALNKDILRKIFETMEALFTAVNEKELAVIKKRIGYDSGNKSSLDKIGIEMDLTKERIRQLELQAWRRIKARASRMMLFGQSVPYSELLEFIAWQPSEKLADFSRLFYSLYREWQVLY